MIRGTDLLTAAEVYGFVDEIFLPSEDRGDVLHVSTNGLAAGNSLTEARLHAVYELIERHVAAVSLRAMGQVRSLLLQDMPSPLREAVAETEAAGQLSEFFLLGTMLGVPVIQCALSPIAAAATVRPGVSFGWGADHSLSIALARALAEAVQGWATRSACMRGDIPPARMRGGMLVSEAQLMTLKTPSAPGEHILYVRLRACAAATVSLIADGGNSLTAPSVALEEIITGAFEGGLRHLFSWTLSPDHRPFAVVKCVIPGFKTLYS